MAHVYLSSTESLEKKPTAWLFQSSRFVLMVSGNILIPKFDPLAWPSSAPACYIQMLLMFTQHSPQSKQSAQLCNMTRVATRSRWRWPQPVSAWVIQPNHNSQLCTSLQSGCIPVTSSFIPIRASTDIMVNYYKSHHRRIKWSTFRWHQTKRIKYNQWTQIVPRVLKPHHYFVP